MKKVALLLYLFFMTVHLAPAVMVFFQKTTTVFIAHEEKGEEMSEEKVDEEENITENKKEKEDYIDFLNQTTTFTLEINTCLNLTEKIHPSPFREKLTPPPNFC